MAEPALEFIIDSPESMHAVGAAIGQALEGGETLALDGELGAGKTVLVRGLAEGLGIDPALVSSPTFVIMQRYRGGRSDLLHGDAYRLRSAVELENAGWFDEASTTPCIRVLEWAGRTEAALPNDALRIEIRHEGAPPRSDSRVATRRRIRLSDPDPDRAARLAQAIEHALAPCACRTCGASLPAGSRMPFCSARCRDADLGRWLGERYRVPRALREEDWDDIGERR